MIKPAGSVVRPPSLPALLTRKIYKTGQTRGADDDVIYQNRVSRSSTVLIPYPFWDECATPQDGSTRYENGFIVLISPQDYFDASDIDSQLAAKGLVLGKNAVVFYETRDQWDTHRPDKARWKPANRRSEPLGGQYVARVPATTSRERGARIVRGFDSTKLKGAGIRVYEYASPSTIAACRLQLEALFWFCGDAEAVANAHGMTGKSVPTRRAAVLSECDRAGLLDISRLTHARVLNSSGHSTCPLCLEELSSSGFFTRIAQADGRAVPDITVTELNLFHIEELRVGALNHYPYNVGWGHHHCNIVVKDAGIAKTIEWMRRVLSRNA